MTTPCWHSDDGVACPSYFSLFAQSIVEFLAEYDVIIAAKPFSGNMSGRHTTMLISKVRYGRLLIFMDVGACDLAVIDGPSVFGKNLPIIIEAADPTVYDQLLHLMGLA